MFKFSGLMITRSYSGQYNCRKIIGVRIWEVEGIYMSCSWALAFIGKVRLRRLCDVPKVSQDPET